VVYSDGRGNFIATESPILFRKKEKKQPTQQVHFTAAISLKNK
jgi:hypothetical protein